MEHILLSHREFFDIFSEKYDILYKDLFKERTQKEIKFINYFLSPCNILDLACGTGRHAIELAKMGYKVVGVDSSLSMLKIAKSKADNQRVKINFVQGDMRRIPLLSSSVEGVICMFSAICHLLSDSCRKAFVEEVYRLLKPCGTVILDVVDWHWLVGKHSYQIDELNHKLRDTIHTEKVFQPPISTRLHHYTEDELQELFRCFSKVELYGDFNLSYFKEGDERIVLVAKK